MCVCVCVCVCIVYQSALKITISKINACGLPSVTTLYVLHNNNMELQYCNVYKCGEIDLLVNIFRINNSNTSNDTLTNWTEGHCASDLVTAQRNPKNHHACKFSFEPSESG